MELRCCCYGCEKKVVSFIGGNAFCDEHLRKKQEEIKKLTDKLEKLENSKWYKPWTWWKL